MQIKTTLVTTTEHTIAREGATVGETINNILRDCVNRDEVVTNVSVVVSQEDWIALRLLRAPAHDDNTVFADNSKPYRKPYRSAMSAEAARRLPGDDD